MVRALAGTVLVAVLRASLPASDTEAGQAAIACTPPVPFVGEVVTLTYRLTCAPGVMATRAGVVPPAGATTWGPPVQSGQRLPTGAEEHVLAWRIAFPHAGPWRIGGTQPLLLPQGGAVDLAAGPLTVQVEPLPPGAPAGSSPVVGPVAWSSTLAPARIRADGGARWTIRLTAAHAAEVPVPTLRLPMGVRAYAVPRPRDTDDDGTWTWMWDVLPSAAGSYALAVAPLVVYDRAQGYHLVALPPVLLPVDAPAAPPATAAAASPAAAALGSTATPTAGGIASPAATGLAALIGVAGGAAVRLLRPRWRQWRARRRPHRHLLRALARDDGAAAAAALARLRRCLAPGAQVTADELGEIIDRRRFGNEPLPPRARDLALRLRGAR